MRLTHLATPLLLVLSALAVAGSAELAALADKRRALTSEFAVLQKSLKDAKTTDQTNAVARKLDDFCLRVNELRGSEYPHHGVLGECDYYRSANWSGTTERALCAKVDAAFNDLKSFPLPTAGNYDPQAINKIQRVLDKMGELLAASEKVRATRR